MQIQFTGHNVEITPALHEFTEQKFKRLFRHADKITSIHVTFDIDKIRQIAEATLFMPGTQIHARSESDDMYKTIDDLIDKLVKQLTKHKEKLTNHRKSPHEN